MGILRTNEKKFLEAISKLSKEKVENDAVHMFFCYERLRQTWNHEGERGIYFKIKRGEKIKDEIDNAKYCFGGDKTDDIFKQYIEYLEAIRDYQEKKFSSAADEKFGNLNLDIENVIKKISKYKEKENDLRKLLSVGEFNDAITLRAINKIRIDISKLADFLSSTTKQVRGVSNRLETLCSKRQDIDAWKGKFKKNYEYQRYILKVAEQIQDWWYGKNNVIMQKGKPFFNKYKNIYELALKCNAQKLKQLIKKEPNEDDSDYAIRMSEYNAMCDKFGNAAVELFNDGKRNKYVIKMQELAKVFVGTSNNKG